MRTITEDAPAKINLTLEVLGRRGDGYHELRSLVAFARDACDVVRLRPAADASLSVIGPFAGAIVGENIMQRALRAIARPNLRLGAVTLDKRLPIASGIGGGSADAAALLRAVRAANAQSDEENLWREIAVGLGADVPVCLANSPAEISGTGTVLHPIAHFPTLHAVLINPMASVPPDKTARVFRELRLAPVGQVPGLMSGPPPPEFKRPEEVVEHVRAHDNRLAEPACRVVPGIADVLAALSRLPDCRIARMSGAGPTCFGLFDTGQAAQEAADRLRRVHPTWWVRPTQLC